METAQPNFMNDIARRKVGGPEGWEICIWERVGEGRLDFVVQGGVPRLLTRGPHKGQKTWRDSPLQKAVVTAAELDAEFSRYESTTGNCGGCGGTGKTVKRWSVTDGLEFKTCVRCQGTGKAPQPATAGREP